MAFNLRNFTRNRRGQVRGVDFALAMLIFIVAFSQIIIVLSNNYIDMVGTLEEWISAFDTIRRGSFLNSFVVRVSDCSLNYLLPNSHFVDFVGSDKEEARKRLTEIVRIFNVVLPDNSRQCPEIKNRSFIKGLPAVWNIPYRKNPNFTGRESFLTNIHRILNSREMDSRILVINGPGGFGKT